MSHVTHMNDWRDIKWMCRVTHMTKSSDTYACVTSRHTHGWVVSYIWMIPSQVAHMKDSWHTKWMSHVTRMNESSHTYEWFTSHIWMSHVTHMTESSRTGLMTHACGWHGTWLDSVMCVTWLFILSHVCDMTHSYSVMPACVCHVTRMHESCHTYEWFLVKSHIWKIYVTQNEWVVSHVHTYEQVIKGLKTGCCARIWHTFWRNISVVFHVTHTDESCDA